MNDRELLAAVALTDPYPADRPLPEGWEPDSIGGRPRDARRSAPMSTINRPPEVHTEAHIEPPSSGRRPWVAAVAAAIVILTAVGFTLLIRGRGAPDVTNPPETTTTAPETGALETAQMEHAQGIASAFYSLDRAALVSAIGNPTADIDTVLTAQANAAALNERLEGTPRCAPGAGTVVCTANTMNDLKEALFTSSADTLRVVFDETTVVTVEWSTASQAAYDRFFAWLDSASVDQATPSCADGLAADDLASCWQSLIALVPGYVNQRDGGGAPGMAEQILEAWLANDIDEVVALTSDIFNPNLPSGLEQAALLNTTVVRRDPCVEAGTNLVECILVVEDDFLRQFSTQRTDVLKVFFFDAGGYVVDVQWESREPDQVTAFWTWLAENRPDVTDGECLASQGTVPDDLPGCWAARIAAVPDFLASQ